MKKYLLIITVLTLSVLLTACGGGGGTSDEAIGGISGGSIVITPCETPHVVANYTLLKSGDTIVKEDDNTTIETFHNVDGNKVVCKNGNAHILR